MSQTLLMVFVGITALAIVIQMGFMVIAYILVKKAHDGLQVVSRKMQEDALALLRDSRMLVAETGPKLRETVDNLNATSATIRRETERLSLAVDEVATRVHHQAARIDDMFTRTLNRAECMGDSVRRAIRSPARQISGVLTGVSVAMRELRRKRKLESPPGAEPCEEMVQQTTAP